MEKGSNKIGASRFVPLWLVLAMAAFPAMAQAAPQYDYGCEYCHKMPPLDSATAKKNPLNGAVPGNHQGHASAAATSCAKCHGNEANSYATGHRNGVIELKDDLGYARKGGGAFLNQTSVPPNPLGVCSSAYCHGDGKGGTKGTPAWGSAPFQAPADCSRCHDVAPATGGHPVAGSKHAAYLGSDSDSCGKCHADHRTEGRPFSHATSAGARAIEVKFAGGGSFAEGECSNLYCHSNGKGSFASATWGGSLDCTGCHGGGASTGAASLSGKHGKHVNNAPFLGTNYACVECHSATVKGDGTILDTGKHVDGTVELAGSRLGGVEAGSCSAAYCHSDGKGAFKRVTWSQSATLDCTGCHGSDSAPAFASVAGEPNYPNAGPDQPRANSHRNHVASAASCVECHSATTADGLSLSAGTSHADGTIDVVAGKGKSFTISGSTCSSVSCHSGGGIVKDVAPAKWGASLGCTGCHGDAATLASNAHARHVGARGYSCATCHSATVSGSSTIVNRALHGDALVEVQGSLTFTAGQKTCSTSCHGPATPSWTDSASGACGTCHRALSTTSGGVIATNAHGAHFGAPYGPGFAAASADSCAICHLYGGETASTHDDAAVQLNLGFSKAGPCSTCHRQQTDWSAGRVSCESCHTGELSVIGGVSAPDKSRSALSGHGSLGTGCNSCHDNSSAHIKVAGGTSRLLAGLAGGANAECNFCHQDAAKVGAPSLNMQGHVATAGSCVACHDPHGTANAKMLQPQLGGSAVSFSGSDFVNAQGTGVCQNCHSATTYYRKGEAEPNHPADDCLSCHQHNTKSGTAFEPNRACDSCHGYPPAPRKVSESVLFGVQGSWSSARFEEYSGGGGGHLVEGHIPKGAKASEGWSNCIPCHSGGAAAHYKAMPMRNHVENVTVAVDAQYRFKDGFIVYSGARFVSGGANRTGSCFNVSCHMSPTPKWSIER